MSGLESKSRTRDEITKEECNYACRLDKKKFPKPDKNEKWVRLKDVQPLEKELKRVQKYFDDAPPLVKLTSWYEHWKEETSLNNECRRNHKT